MGCARENRWIMPASDYLPYRACKKRKMVRVYRAHWQVAEKIPEDGMYRLVPLIREHGRGARKNRRKYFGGYTPVSDWDSGIETVKLFYKIGEEIVPGCGLCSVSNGVEELPEEVADFQEEV